MVECNLNLKNILCNLCILIIMIIIVRVLYIRLYSKNITSKDNSKIEGFTGNIDLLSKQKSNSIKIGTDTSNVINPWTTKFYNMQSPSTQTKQIALYQPLLVIKNEQYCKLGDILSQNVDYAPPNSDQNTLLIKNSSDIKPPVDYELVVNFGDEYVNTKYYEYESYIKNTNTINVIKPSLTFCSNTINEINNIVINNITTLQTNVKSIFKIVSVINNDILDVHKPVSLESLTNGPITIPLSIVLGNKFLSNYNDFNKAKPPMDSVGAIHQIPAGVSGILKYSYIYNNDGVIRYIEIPFNFPASINTAATDAERISIVTISNTSYPFLDISAANFVSINNSDPMAVIPPILSGESRTPGPMVNKTFENIPVMQIIDYLTKLCNNITIIYDNNKSNQPFLTFLNLVDSKDTIIAVLDKIDTFKQFIISHNNINSMTIVNTPDIHSYYNDILTTGSLVSTSLLGKICSYIRNTNVYYSTTVVKIYKPNLPILPQTFASVASITNITYESITYNRYDNANILNNLPNGAFNMLNDVVGSTIKPTIDKLLQFTKCINDLQNNAIKDLPLKIYKPIPPPGYVAVGHVFCNVQIQLQNIKENAAANIGVCCIPDNCIKEMNDWTVSDKVFEYSKEGVYWALYFNKYTGTFVSTNRNELPSGKMCKVVACVTKCTAVEELQKSDSCARGYYNLNKTINTQKNKSADLFSDKEEEYYLAKIKSQSDNLTRLSKRAQQMELDIDKANIVNREMNKNKLQSYVDKQKVNIDLILQRLIRDKDSIQTNINIPKSILDKLLDMIKNLKDMTDEDKLKIISKLIKNQSCPDPNLEGLVKKQLVSDVCYGCDNV